MPNAIVLPHFNNADEYEITAQKINTILAQTTGGADVVLGALLAAIDWGGSASLFERTTSQYHYHRWMNALHLLYWVYDQAQAAGAVGERKALVFNDMSDFLWLIPHDAYRIICYRTQTLHFLYAFEGESPQDAVLHLRQLRVPFVPEQRGLPDLKYFKQRGFVFTQDDLGWVLSISPAAKTLWPRAVPSHTTNLALDLLHQLRENWEQYQQEMGRG